MKKREKVFDNGINYVAVLVSWGYGAGWSTWNGDHENLLFDPNIVDMLEQDNPDLNAIKEYCEKTYEDGYFGGLKNLEVVWIPKGKKFRIVEYDGDEYAELMEDIDWITA